MTTRVEPLDKTLDINGLKLRYLDWGSPESPALVLLHGLRGHAHSWDDVSPRRCVTATACWPWTNGGEATATGPLAATTSLKPTWPTCWVSVRP